MCLQTVRPSQARDMLCSGRGSEVCLAQLTFVCWLAGHTGQEWGVRVGYCAPGPELPTTEQRRIVFVPRVSCQNFLLVRMYYVCWCHTAEQAVGLEVLPCTCQHTVTHQIFVLLSQVCLVSHMGLQRPRAGVSRLPGLHLILLIGGRALACHCPSPRPYFFCL